MILTTKKIAEDYGMKESKVRKMLRDSDIPKVQEGYFWWIDEQHKGELDKLFLNDSKDINKIPHTTENPKVKPSEKVDEKIKKDEKNNIE
jgi:hypothetical protein